MAGRVDRLLALSRTVSVARSTATGEQRAASLLPRGGVVKGKWGWFGQAAFKRMCSRRDVYEEVRFENRLFIGEIEVSPVEHRAL